MPHESIGAPEHDRSRSLGWLALAWMEYFIVYAGGDVQGRPVEHGDEYSAFVVDCYALEPKGRRLYDSVFLSRPKGCDKSGLASRFVLFEALGPCRFAGFAQGGEIYEDPWGLGFEYEYVKGEPMGRPVRVPHIRCLAVEEHQTGAVYDSVWFNLSSSAEECEAALLRQVPGIKVGLEQIVLPDSGTIIASTSSDGSKDGGKETFVVFDETHLYLLPKIKSMYATVARNLRKRKKGAGTWYLETTTMFAVGAESMAEATYKLAEQIREGKVRRPRLLFDHRWGECEDLSDEKALGKAITEAYGDAMAWQELESLIDEFWDPRADPADSARYFLNSPSSAPNAWVVAGEWEGCKNLAAELKPRQMITLGFDGSRRRTRKVTDATALIGCRVSDGLLFELPGGSVWEQPMGPAGEEWQVPVAKVNAAVSAAFKRFQVVGFFADPAKWETHVAEWEALYGPRLKVKSTVAHPIQWWMTGGRVGLIVKALDRFLNAVIDRAVSHDGSEALTRHILNARRQATKSGITIRKEHPESKNKIDAAVAAVLAHEARLEAVAKGVKPRRRSTAQALNRGRRSRSGV